MKRFYATLKTRENVTISGLVMSFLLGILSALVFFAVLLPPR